MAGGQAAGPAPQPSVGGWHPVEWGCEFLGTALLLLVGTSAVVVDFHRGWPLAHHLPSVSGRLLLTGRLFPATGSLFALTPAGRRSGAHLNPAVTVAFWVQRHVHPHDLVGYTLAQTAGALTGAAAARLLWGSADVAAPVRYAMTVPRPGLPAWGAVGIEAAMTAGLVLAIFWCLSRPALMRLTPFAVWLLVAVLVWRVAPYTGTSLNPARTIGPDVVAGGFPTWWAYLLGPLGGAALAAGGWRLAGARRTLTAKLFHDPRYRSTMRTEMPARPAPTPAGG